MWSGWGPWVCSSLSRGAERTPHGSCSSLQEAEGQCWALLRVAEARPERMAWSCARGGSLQLRIFSDSSLISAYEMTETLSHYFYGHQTNFSFLWPATSPAIETKHLPGATVQPYPSRAESPPEDSNGSPRGAPEYQNICRAGNVLARPQLQPWPA